MSSSLESAYRSTLRWYPRRWRAEHADALVGILLEVAEGQGRSSITWSERMNLAGHGFATRLDAILSQRGRDLAASFALGTGLAIALVYFLVEEWMPWVPLANHARPETTFGPFADAGVLVVLLWVAALVCTILRRFASARTALILSAILSVLLLVSQRGVFELGAGPLYFNPDKPTFVLLTALSLVACVGTIRNRTALGITAIAWILGLAGTLVLTDRFTHESVFGLAWYDYFERLLWQSALFVPQVVSVLALILLISIALFIGRRRNSAVALVLSTLPWLACAAAGWYGAGDAVVSWVTAAILFASAIAVLVVGARFAPRDSSPKRASTT